MSKAKSKQEEALAFLDDLDSMTPRAIPVPTNATNPTGGSGEGEAEVLAFIDEITQKSAEPTPRSSHLERPASRSGTPTVRKSTERVRLGGGMMRTSSSSSLKKDAAGTLPTTTTVAEPGSAGGGWGWGSVWNSASVALQQAKSAVDEQVKYLPKNEQARKWGEGMMEYAKSAQLDKLGQDFKRVGLSTLTDILNVVAPPISEHEVIQVWLSHDMKGYEGIESLVYRALARIMEQVEGGDLVVNRGEEARPKESADSANLDDLINNNTKATVSKSESNVQTPTTYSHVYLRIQPFMTSFAFPASSSASGTTSHQQLQFLIHLSDPSHNVSESTVTQCVPGDWLADGMWEKYEWVEDLIAESLRVGVEVIGQAYIVKRMGWGPDTISNEESTVESKTDTVGEPGELVEKPKLGEET
ncbi:maintenance of telomere capping protein 1 [Mycena pura]|uniref:Maintenance of telomere capping protein 1 n=1 Tax=Mycena pura TaxID=153505 RepID=A0AAD6YPZ7_9AGAR|nr:maintenance of telomere capping protein 1 [Mycena pura]